MSLAGWTLPQLGLLFGGGAVAITLLYLLRMRRREVVVPFAALWERVARESESRQIWRKLRRLLSWLVQLAILALIALALGDPRPEVWLRDPVTVAIVLDRSASMSAASGDDDGRTRLDQAKARAITEVQALGPMDRAVIIAAGEEVAVAAPLSGDPTVLIPAIEALEPTFGEADLRRGLALATHAVADASGARIVVLTDGAIDPDSGAALEECSEGEVPCDVIGVEGPNPNLAITAFAARRYPDARDKIEVLAEVRNLGDAPAAVDLDIEADGVSVGKRRLELAPGQVRREVVGDLDAARSRFEARLLTATDAAAGLSLGLGPEFDDIAYAVVPPLSPLEVGLVSDGTNLFLDAALLNLGEHVKLTGVEAGTDELDDFDVVFFDMGDEPLPEAFPDTHVVVFDPWRHEVGPSPIPKAADVARPFLTEQARKHPVLADVVFKDVNIGRGTTFATEPGDTVLVRSLGAPIVVLRERGNMTLAIGFDPRQSDFPLRMAFPLLIDNIVSYVEQRTPGFVASIKLGQSRGIRLADLGLGADGVARVEVTDPTGAVSDLPVERGELRLRALIPGVYEIAAADGEAAGAAVELAVNQTSVDASDLHSKLDQLDLASADAEAPEPEPAPPYDGPLWTIIMLLAATIIAVEWATYHRRVTV